MTRRGTVAASAVMQQETLLSRCGAYRTAPPRLLPPEQRFRRATSRAIGCKRARRVRRARMELRRSGIAAYANGRLELVDIGALANWRHQIECAYAAPTVISAATVARSRGKKGIFRRTARRQLCNSSARRSSSTHRLSGSYQAVDSSPSHSHGTQLRSARSPRGPPACGPVRERHRGSPVRERRSVPTK